ncbi:Adenylosuccinate synthetase [Exophiala dermatitidis]
MPITVVLGSQWGDEGKGKLVDLLSSSCSLVARAAGGHNAGHTIVADGMKYDFHILPSALVNLNCKVNLIGAGCVVHVRSFFKELEALEAKGLKDVRRRVQVSDRAHICFDIHGIVDMISENTERCKVGTTRKGIGPSYSDKVGRHGVPVWMLVNGSDRWEQQLRSLAARYRNLYGDGALQSYDLDGEIEYLKAVVPELKQYVVDQALLLSQFSGAQGLATHNVLIEGANAFLLDIDHGTYPYVTSSSTGLGGVFTSLAGLTPYSFSTPGSAIIGVVKAYTTRVGLGPFPTELLESTSPTDAEYGSRLQQGGQEVGVTTGRPRRCGWLDLVVVKYSATLNCYTEINLTKLDVLDSFDVVRVATAYSRRGQVLQGFPADLDDLADVEVEYKTFEGWQTRTQGATRFEDLPTLAQQYVGFIEKEVGVPITSIGTGPSREAMIFHRRACTFDGIPSSLGGGTDTPSPDHSSPRRDTNSLEAASSAPHDAQWRLIRTRQGHSVEEYDHLDEPSLMTKTLGMLNNHHCRYMNPAISFRPSFLGFMDNAGLNNTNVQRQRVRWVSPTDAFLLIRDLGTPAESEQRADVEAVESLVRPYIRTLHDIYFRVVYPVFPVLHRPVFIEKYGRSPFEFAPASLAVVYLLAIRYWSYEPSLQHKPMPNVTELEAIARRCLQYAIRHRPKLSTIQAGLQLLQYSDTDSEELTRQLINAGHQIGLHLDATQWDIPDWEKTLRKRLSWTLYSQDKWHSFETGSPAIINRANWGVPKITEQDFPEQSEYEQEGSSDVEKGRLLFCQLIYLSEILGDILENILSVRATTEVACAGEGGLELLLQKAKPHQAHLRQWFSVNSGHLSMEVSNVNKLSPVGSLRLAYVATEMSLHRQILLTLPTCSDDALIQLCRKTASERFQFAANLVKSLKPNHLVSFWYSMTSYNFALAGEFICHLYLTESNLEQRQLYLSRLREYRWLLTMSNSRAPYINQALQRLEVPFKYLLNSHPQDDQTVHGHQEPLEGFTETFVATSGEDDSLFLNDWLDESYYGS